MQTGAIEKSVPSMIGLMRNQNILCDMRTWTIKLMFPNWTRFFALLEIVQNYLHTLILIVSRNSAGMTLFVDAIRNGNSTRFTTTHVMNACIEKSIVKDIWDKHHSAHNFDNKTFVSSNCM